MWKDHVWKRQTINDLTKTYGKSEKTIRTILDRAETRPSVPIPAQCVVCIFDATHIGDDVLLNAREPNLRSNLGWAWIESETKESYAALKANLESRGFHLKAVVLDGRTGIPRVFEGIPVQICQFHQLQIVRRKLTLRPETKAGQTLLAIGFSISKNTEAGLTKDLEEWFKEYGDFINEKTYITGTRRWRSRIVELEPHTTVSKGTSHIYIHIKNIQTSRSQTPPTLWMAIGVASKIF